MTIESAAERAELALLLEVATTPTPGNVDRARDISDLRFEQFLAGSIGARNGLSMAESGEPIGRSFEQAVSGMADLAGENTQFGALLLLVPLVAATNRSSERVAEGGANCGETSPTETITANAKKLVAETTVPDAIAFYEAFDHVSIAIESRPAGVEVPDVRQGSEAAKELRANDWSLADVLEQSRPYDAIAAELIGGFNRTRWAAEAIASGQSTTDERSLTDRAAAVHVELLASVPDTHVRRQHGNAVAEEVTKRARAVRDGETEPAAFANELIEREINPGTTADLLAGGLYLAMQQGCPV